MASVVAPATVASFFAFALPLAGGCTNTDNHAAIVDAGPGSTDTAGGPLGHLWYAGAGLNAYTEAAAAEADPGAPGLVVVPTGGTNDFHDLAFDGSGNLWAVPIAGDEIVRLPAAMLASGAPTPDLVITGAALKSPHSIVFDAAGNLWVMCYDGAGPTLANVVRFDDPRALMGAQTLSPSLAFGPGSTASAPNPFSQGMAIAFDGRGSLWFLSISSALRIDGPGAMSGDVAAAPAAVVSTGDSFASLAFDAAGALWITGARGSYVVLRIDHPETLAGTVSAAPSAVVGLPSSSSLFAGGLAFDRDGSLWIAMSDQIVRLTNPAGLSGASTATPAASLHPVLPDLASKLIVRPPPPGLPIHEP